MNNCSRAHLMVQTGETQTQLYCHVRETKIAAKCQYTNHIHAHITIMYITSISEAQPEFN